MRIAHHVQICAKKSSKVKLFQDGKYDMFK
jgi:hypothetical protein